MVLQISHYFEPKFTCNKCPFSKNCMPIPPFKAFVTENTKIITFVCVKFKKTNKQTNTHYQPSTCMQSRPTFILIIDTKNLQ